MNILKKARNWNAKRLDRKQAVAYCTERQLEDIGIARTGDFFDTNKSF